MGRRTGHRHPDPNREGDAARAPHGGASRGAQPGPALWKVSSGDRELWILGEVAPLPRKVKWKSKQFEDLLAGSQEVILHDTRGNTLATVNVVTNAFGSSAAVLRRRCRD